MTAARTWLEAVTAEDDVTEHTWRPENLIQLAENPPAPPTIGGLLYPAKRTVLSGETESMKTWFALMLCKSELDIGIPVGWVDLDAMGPGALLERLQLLGVTEEQIGDFLYYEPSEMLTPEKTKDVAATITERGIRFFVIDAFNPILSLHGLDPNSNPDIEKFWRHIADPIANAGAAPVLLDHVVKNADNRGKYSTGSERKASGAIVHIGFRLLQPLTKGGVGKSVLTVHKDRPGYLPRPSLGRLVITSAEDHTITYRLEHDKSHDGDGFRPTVLMEKISGWLATQTGPVSRNAVEDAVTGKREALRTALDVLADEGYLIREPGPRNAQLFTHLKPYSEADDTPQTTSPPLRPDFALDLRSSTVSDFAPAPLLRGEGRSQTGEPSQPRPNLAPELIHEYEFPPLATFADHPEAQPGYDPEDW